MSISRRSRKRHLFFFLSSIFPSRGKNKKIEKRRYTKMENLDSRTLSLDRRVVIYSRCHSLSHPIIVIIIYSSYIFIVPDRVTDNLRACNPFSRFHYDSTPNAATSDHGLYRKFAHPSNSTNISDGNCGISL